MANDITNNLNEQRAHIAGICEVAGAPGLAVGVIQNDRIIFEDFQGYRDVELGLKPNEDTIFFVASLTKAITAAAIGMLVDDGSMDWTTPVHDILPELSRPSALSDAKLNVLDVLSHQTGITWADALYLQSNNNILLPKSECICTINYLPVVKPPRSAFIYNNHAYNIAGLIVERLSGMNYGDFVRQRIFGPLGMERTFTEQPDDSNVALPYNILLDKTPFKIPFSKASGKSMMFAGQSIRSSLKDLLCLYGEYLRSMRKLDMRTTEENTDHPAGTNERSVDRAFGAVTESSPFKQMATIVTPRISRVIDGLLEQTYALGWNRTQLPGKLDFGWNSGLVESLPIIGQRAPSTLAIWHGGDMPGTTVAVCLLPKPGIGIVVLQNSLGLCDAADWVCQLIVETILAGAPANDYIALASESVAKGGQRMKEVAEHLEAERIPGTRHRPLASYTGLITTPFAIG